MSCLYFINVSCMLIGIYLFICMCDLIIELGIPIVGYSRSWTFCTVYTGLHFIIVNFTIVKNTCAGKRMGRHGYISL